MLDQAGDPRKVPLRGTIRHFPGFGQAAIILRRLGEIIGFAGQDRAGRRSRAQTTETGQISWEATGQAPRGEENTLYVCQTLVEAWRDAGEDWSAPVRGRGEPVDCETCNPRGELKRIQVVRAVIDPPLWQRLAQTRATGRQDSTSSDLATQICEAINAKAAKLPPAIKVDLVLALDATRTPGHTLTAVVNEFHQAHGRTCAEAGFREVWVVGPFASTVARIDVRGV